MVLALAYNAKHFTATFFVFLFLVVAIFFAYILWIDTQDACDQYWTNFIGHTEKCLCEKWSVSLKFRVCENDMLIALEKIAMMEVSEHNLHMLNSTFTVILPYSQECSCFLG